MRVRPSGRYIHSHLYNKLLLLHPNDTLTRSEGGHVDGLHECTFPRLGGCIAADESIVAAGGGLRQLERGGRTQRTIADNHCREVRDTGDASDDGPMYYLDSA